MHGEEFRKRLIVNSVCKEVDMKIGERLKYQQLVDSIQFPVVIFIFETRRIIAINKRAKDIIVPDGKLLRYMPDLKIKSQVSQQILSEEDNMLLDTPIMVGMREIRIDLELNSIELDGRHLVIMVFDYTENESFGDKFLKHVPRIFWKDKRLKLKGVNYFCREDIQKSGIIFEDIDKVHDNDYTGFLIEDETRVIKTKQPLWNVMQLMQPRNEPSRFINIQRLPIINKNGTVVGILGVYHLLLSKEEMEEEIKWLKSEKSRLTKLLAINDTIFFRVRLDEEWSVEYVTPNIKELGYTSLEFYLKKVTFRDLVLKEDIASMVQDFMSCKNRGTRKVELEYRIKKADGSLIWVNGQCMYMDSEYFEKAEYIDCIIRDITGMKTLQKELEVSRDALQAKIDAIKKGEILIKSVRFTDLFNMTELLSTLKCFSDLMNISCTITDYVGRTLCDIIRRPYIAKEVYEYYENREGREVFRNLYRMVKNSESMYLFDKVNGIYIYGVPFIVDDKCIGILDILTKEIIPSDSPMMALVEDLVERSCSSVQKNIELFRERDKQEKALSQLKIAQKKGDFLSQELEIALTENNLYKALNKIIHNLAQYVYVGEILLFRQNSGLSYFEKQVEWNTNGEENRKVTQVYEKLNLSECGELAELFKHTNIVIYQQGEIPEYLQRQFGSRRVKRLAMIMFEFELSENVILVFCDHNVDSEWTKEKITLLTDISNIIKVVLQRIVIKKEL